MKVKCEYCGQFIEDTASSCPYCNGVNIHMHRMSKDMPKTIDSLKEYCTLHNISPDDVRFYIDKNYPGPRAFGIYQDGKNFIVYENDSLSKRTILYQGTDEAYAVSEIYLKLREHTLTQKEHTLQGRALLHSIQEKEERTLEENISDAEERYLDRHLKKIIIYFIVGFILAVAALLLER